MLSNSTSAVPRTNNVGVITVVQITRLTVEHTTKLETSKRFNYNAEAFMFICSHGRRACVIKIIDYCEICHPFAIIISRDLMKPNECQLKKILFRFWRTLKLQLIEDTRRRWKSFSGLKCLIRPRMKSTLSPLSSFRCSALSLCSSLSNRWVHIRVCWSDSCTR